MKKNSQLIIFVVVLATISLFWRLYGLNQQGPFWVDEFSTANQARLLIANGIGVLTNQNIFFEHHNFTTYIAAALSMIALGESEFAARLPFAIIGAFVPIAVFFLTKRLFDTRAAIAAAILSTFSYFLITWSRQARGYVILQLAILIT